MSDPDLDAIAVPALLAEVRRLRLQRDEAVAALGAVVSMAALSFGTLPDLARIEAHAREALAAIEGQG